MCGTYCIYLIAQLLGNPAGVERREEQFLNTAGGYCSAQNSNDRCSVLWVLTSITKSRKVIAKQVLFLQIAILVGLVTLSKQLLCKSFDKEQSKMITI